MIESRAMNKNAYMTLGFASLLIWVSLMRYYNTSRGYNVIMSTLSNSSSIVIKAAIGILPFFVGMALLGMCIFWPSN